MDMKLDDGVPGVRRIWLVRHGESTWNAKDLVQGQLDPELSPSGREQAARCSRNLASRARPEAVYSSDLRRALETATPIAHALGAALFVEPGLRERSLGDAEGLPSARLDPPRSGVSRGQVVDADAAPTGGESVRQLYERAVSCAARILSEHRGDVVLVCHGGVVRVLSAWFDGVTPDEMSWPDVENGVPILRMAPAASTWA
jgi:broad specificity phosphatase PhoE